MIPINEYLRSRRNELGLSDIEVSAKSGLSIYEYGDLEAHSHEFYEQISMAQAKKICEVLKVNIRDFVPECTSAVSSVPLLSRNLILSQERQRAGLTRKQLAEQIGYEVIAIEEAEASEENLDSMCLASVLDIANALKIDPCIFL
jgi:transcriptional regulator with XRE-family HTH domain